MKWNENKNENENELAPLPPFLYKAIGYLKGPGNRTAKFHNHCEIFACTVFHLQNQQKFDLGKLK